MNLAPLRSCPGPAAEASPGNGLPASASASGAGGEMAAAGEEAEATDW